jgi:hypothetical protein
MVWFSDPSINQKNFLWEFLQQLSDSVYGALMYLMQEMVKLITVFPSVRQMPELYTIWKYMLFLSLTCIPLMFILCGSRNLFSLNGNIIRQIELKSLLTRLCYMLVLILGSLPFIDWMVILNNTLIEVLVVRFNVHSTFAHHVTAPTLSGNFIATALIIYQMYLAIKIIIGYWLRVAELNLMAVVSPAVFTMWINPGWGSYLGAWTSRIYVLIFTQFVQVLILIIYGQTLYRFYETGTVPSLCLSIATLILMNNVPAFFQLFAGRDNAGHILNNTWRNVRGLPSRAKSGYDGVVGTAGKIKSVIKKFKP